jgi:uncharacterized protein with GYD domain
MPTYIALARYTHQGIQNVNQGPARLDASNKPSVRPEGS